MELLPSWPDVEDIGLALFVPVGPTVLVTPATITPPLVVVRRVGGFDDKITDQALLQVQTFGGSHAQGRALAEQCRQRVFAAVATEAAGVSIDRVSTESAPQFVDYGDLKLHRYVAVYGIEFRRIR